MTRILVRPDDLVDLAGQLRRSGEALVGILQGANGAYQRMDTEVRALSDVASGLYTLERLMLVQGPALERLVRYLERQAEGFREADGAQDPLPAAPLPVGMPLESSPLSLAPKAREATPAWVYRVSGGLKLVGGVMAAADGVKMMGAVLVPPLGLAMLPLGVMSVVHGVCDVAEGIHELASGEDQTNAMEQLYQRSVGEERGSAVYKWVERGLTAVDLSFGLKGTVKTADKILLEVMTDEGLYLKAADEFNLPQLIYEHLWR